MLNLIFLRFGDHTDDLHAAGQAILATCRICSGTMGIEPLNADGALHMMSKNEAWTQ
jgi:hypothetical protein